MNKIMCVYEIRNIVNNKIYIGSSEHFGDRKTAHLYWLKKGKHHSQYLQNAYNKYGKNNFIITPLEIINDKNELFVKEQYYIDTKKPEYNIVKEVLAPMRGRHHSEETKKKLSIANKGHCSHIQTEEIKNKIRETLKGRTFSKETLEKISAANTGKIRTKEQKEILNKARLKSKDLYSGENSGVSKLTWENVNFIRNNYPTKTTKELSVLFNCKINTILQVLKNRSWIDNNFIPFYQGTLTKEQVKFIRDNNKFKSFKEMALLYNVSIASINAIIRNKTHIDPSYIPLDKNNKIDDNIKSQIKNELYYGNLSMSAIARKFNVSRGTVTTIRNMKNGN